jgi:hypothetical protein
VGEAVGEVVGEFVDEVDDEVDDEAGDVVGEPVGALVGGVVGALGGEIVGALGGEVGEPVGVPVGVGVPVAVGAGPDALVSGAAASTGAQAAASLFAAAFIASRAFCIGAGSGMVTVAPPEVPVPPRLVDAVEPVEPVGVPVEPVEARVELAVEPVEAPDDVREEAPDPAVVPDPPDALDAVVVADSSVVSCACAWSNAARASVTAACNGVWSRVASCWPGVTVSPTLTRTPVTVPLTGKAAVTWETRLTVPVSVSVCDTDPLVTVASR